jgi:hypothetical protein
MAVPAARPTATPVMKRPISSPGSAFHAASKPAAAIIVATAPSITPRRPARAATNRTDSNAAIVPAAKIA